MKLYEYAEQYEALKQMAEDVYQFYLSVNGVWLTKEVPVQYLSIL